MHEFTSGSFLPDCCHFVFKTVNAFSFHCFTGDFVMHYSSFTSHSLVIYLSFTNTFNRYLLISCIAHPFIEFPSLESILLFGHFCIHFCKVCLCAGVHLCIASHHSGNIQWMNFKMNEWKNWQMRAHKKSWKHIALTI